MYNHCYDMEPGSLNAAAKALVIHDHPLAYEGIRSVLDREGSWEVIGEARSAAEALAYCMDSPPDVVVLDICPPDSRAIEVLDQLSSLCPDVPIVVLTRTANPHGIQQAVRLGAHGFVSKESPPDRLISAIRAARAGEFYVGPLLTRELMDMLRIMPDSALQRPDAGYDSLSAREREVFCKLAEGMSNKRIAFALGISRKTVETHHLRIMRKLGIDDPLDLLRYAARIGLIDVDEWTRS